MGNAPQEAAPAVPPTIAFIETIRVTLVSDVEKK